MESDKNTDTIGEINLEDDSFNTIVERYMGNHHLSRSEDSLTTSVPHHPIVGVAKLRAKKIPQKDRRKKLTFKKEGNFFHRHLSRLKADSQYQRSTVQVAFALLCIWIGIEFHFFMKWAISAGRQPYIERPPGVEGFLPISSLMGLVYWFYTGVINEIHPSGLFIFVAILAVSFLLKKSFCSWLCPIGTLSESLWMLGQKLFGKNLKLTRWLDYPLRVLKYLVLIYFLYAIFSIDVAALRNFIYSPYHKVADIKMYLFFADISTFVIWTIAGLMVLSVVIKNFWCRYLCPYGALLGALSWLSPIKVTRNKLTCIDCELCSKACPSNIKVHNVGQVWSDECTACLSCVEVCPIRNTLNMRITKKSKPITSWVFGVLVIGVFVGITGFAILIENWQNKIPKEEYLRRISELDKPVYQHFRGEVPPYSPND